MIQQSLVSFTAWCDHSLYSQKAFVSPWRESQNHRKVWLQRTLKGHLVQSPAMRNQEVPLVM